MRELSLLLGAFLLQLESLPLHQQLDLDSLQKAMLVVLPAWDLSVLFQVGTISFLRETMRFRV